MAKLERLAQLAKKKTLFDDRPVEVEELTYVCTSYRKTDA
jgi:syntaxin 5